VIANLGDRPCFRRHRQSSSGDALLGPAVRGKSDGEWVITLSRCFNRPDGSFAGVVVGTIAARDEAQDEVLPGWRSAVIVRTSVVLGLVVLIALIGLNLVRQMMNGQRMAAELSSKEASFRVLAEGSSDMVTN
jgi:hypothetical protein